MCLDDRNKEISVYNENDCSAIKDFFQSNISGLFGITHFSIILITKEKKQFILSSSKNFTINFSKNKYHQYDNTLNPIMYENLKFYTWSKGYSTIKQDEIKAIKKEYGLNNGTVFVRNLPDGNILLYCVATKKADPIMKTIFVNNANSILLLGDNAYNEMTGFFEEKSVLYLPKIGSFVPFLQDEIINFTDYENDQKSKIAKVIKGNNKEGHLHLVIDNTKK